MTSRELSPSGVELSPSGGEHLSTVCKRITSVDACLFARPHALRDEPPEPADSQNKGVSRRRAAKSARPVRATASARLALMAGVPPPRRHRAATAAAAAAAAPRLAR